MSTSRRYVNKLLCFYICMYTGVIHCATCRKYILNKILNLYFCLKFTNSLEKRPIIYIILFQLAQHIMYERFVTLYSTTGLCESTYVTALSQEVSIPRLTEICDRVKFHNADMKHGVPHWNCKVAGFDLKVTFCYCNYSILFFGLKVGHYLVMEVTIKQH